MLTQPYHTTSARTAALAVILIAFGLALSGAIGGLSPATTPAQAQPILATPALAIATQAPIILVATPTPGMAPIPAIAPAQAAPTMPPLEPEVAPAPVLVDPEPPAVPEPTLSPERAAADTLNDPALNGGNIAPAGCPFPIINGVCGNGLPVPADDAGFGEKDKSPLLTTKPIKGAPERDGRARP